MDEDRVTVNRKYRDRLFRLVFGSGENRGHLLSLYNAVSGTEYDDSDVLEITTIDDVVFMGMKNDISFIAGSEMDLFEHQSTFNPNMPLRGLLYYARLYEKYLRTCGKDIYGKGLVGIPAPRYVVFYNGTGEYPDRKELRLSDAFGGRTEGYEWSALMLNINRGHNAELMEKCGPLREYADLVHLIREYNKEMPLEAAADTAVREASGWEHLGRYLAGHRSEVREVILTEYDEELHERTCREEGRAEGIKQGRAEGIRQGRTEGRTEGIKLARRIFALNAEGYSTAEIAGETGVSEEEVKSVLE